MVPMPKVHSSPPIILVLADSNVMGCELLSEILSKPGYGIKVTASAVDRAGILRAASTHRPDVILLSADLRDGPHSGFEAMRQIQRTDPKARVIMLLDEVERESVVAAFRGGAKGVYARSDSLQRLWKCIRAVHEGQIWATSGQLQFLLEELVRTRPARVWNARGKELLTPREGQIVRLVAEGLTNREISREIGISEHTVKNCVFRVYNKLGVSTRVELTLYALGQERADSVTVPRTA